MVALVAGFVSAGALLGARAARTAAQPELLAWQRQASLDRPVSVVGILREDAAKAASGVAVTVDLTQVDGVAADGGVRLAIAGALAADASSAWRAGREISAVATLREPLDYRDPGVPSDRERLARQGIFLIGSVKSAALAAIVKRGGTLSEAAAALRASVRNSTASAVGRWSLRSAGVVTAILIGDRTGLDAEDERRLQEAGTYHVIAISGGNIALLTLLLVSLGRWLRLPPRATAAASVAILGFYGYAAGLAPSVLRATIAGMIYLAARALDHRGPPLNALAVAAALSAAASPLAILDAGFVLSFGATAAIVIAASRIVPATPAKRETAIAACDGPRSTHRDDRARRRHAVRRDRARSRRCAPLRPRQPRRSPAQLHRRAADVGDPGCRPGGGRRDAAVVPARGRLWLDRPCEHGRTAEVRRPRRRRTLAGHRSSASLTCGDRAAGTRHGRACSWPGAPACGVSLSRQPPPRRSCCCSAPARRAPRRWRRRPAAGRGSSSSTSDRVTRR